MNMKKGYMMILAALLLTAGVACSDDEVVLFEPGLTLNRMELEPVGGMGKVRVNIAGRWAVSCGESWLQVTPANGNGPTDCIIKVDTTILANEERKASVQFIAEKSADSYEIDVVQKGFEKALTLSKTEVVLENYAEFGKRYFDVELTSNVEFEIQIPEKDKSWLKYKEYHFVLDRGACPRTTTIRFEWEGNNEMQPRETKVLFHTEEENLVEHDALIVSQDRAPEITPDRAGDSLALVICERKLNIVMPWDKRERLQNWSGVKLWEETDKGVTPEKLGRVRSVQFSFMKSEEPIPDEIRYLEYLESLSIYSNFNWRRYSFKLGSAITTMTNLKHLQIYAYGLTELPQGFSNLKNLEVLDLSGNNFHYLPEVLCEDSLPNLRHLNLVDNRRSLQDDICLESMPEDQWGGFYGENNGDQINVLNKLFKWQKLESLLLSNNIIQGQVPAFDTYADRDFPKYTQADIDNPLKGDSLKHAKLVGTPKVLPNCKDLRIGLNYLHGRRGTNELPFWLLHHPYLGFWTPEISIFRQQEHADKNGNESGFKLPENFDYYFDEYPFYLEDEEE